ncbi:hypothetical protein M758_2G247200 [Ceratodon purpureus]|nr:hypothetical protein M758_2G247200 [Ceratodon purpureus]
MSIISLGIQFVYCVCHATHRRYNVVCSKDILSNVSSLQLLLLWGVSCECKQIRDPSTILSVQVAKKYCTGSSSENGGLEWRDDTLFFFSGRMGKHLIALLGTQARSTHFLEVRIVDFLSTFFPKISPMVRIVGCPTQFWLFFEAQLRRRVFCLFYLLRKWLTSKHNYHSDLFV